MAMFNSYVKLPEGISPRVTPGFQQPKWGNQNPTQNPASRSSRSWKAGLSPVKTMCFVPNLFSLTLMMVNDGFPDFLTFFSPFFLLTSDSIIMKCHEISKSVDLAQYLGCPHRPGRWSAGCWRWPWRPATAASRGSVAPSWRTASGSGRGCNS